ncbi:MAG: WYL domain-containing protein [Candidatus Omnitrophica bacterium]|nr:WYL domain-containing protein [Candidatus Omnitrophota bacterium]MBU1922943.1 WYL domain-containing protein [Candidatus Omnitrophota bacterium]
MLKHIDEVEFTIFDTETTGLNPASGDRIVELAGLRVKGKERIAEFDVLVNPEREISPEAFAVNKITPEMLKDAPGIEIIMPRFLDFIQGSYLCSYNVEFDLRFLDNELKIIGLPVLTGHAAFDILTIAKRLMPNQQRYALWFIADKLGVKARQQHRAFSDVEMAWEVFNRFKNMCQEKGIIDFNDFFNLFAFNPGFLESSASLKVSQIEKAINLKAHLKIKYLSTKGAGISLREVVPREIRQDTKNKYLIGFCCLRKEERVFKVDNIVELEIV